MNVGASGPQSGPTAIVAATKTAHHAGRTTCRPMKTTPSSPTKPIIAVKSWTDLMLCPATAATGDASTTWPIRVIETQPLNVSLPVSTQRKRVRR